MVQDSEKGQRGENPCGAILRALKEVFEEALKSSPPGRRRITRHAMYARLENILAADDGPNHRCSAVSKSGGLARIAGLRTSQITVTEYPKANMLNLEFADNGFDSCVSDQVLEHVEGDPFQAVSESFRVVRRGGAVLHTTCFINQLHGFPKDFWRFSPDALRLMCKAAGAEVIECGGWGNREVWAYISLGLRDRKVPTDPAHPIHKLALKNDPVHPLSTWVCARKVS